MPKFCSFPSVVERLAMAYADHPGPIARLLEPGIDRLRFLAACGSYLGAFASLQLTGRVPGIRHRLRTLVHHLRHRRVPDRIGPTA